MSWTRAVQPDNHSRPVRGALGTAGATVVVVMTTTVGSDAGPEDGAARHVPARGSPTPGVGLSPLRFGPVAPVLRPGRLARVQVMTTTTQLPPATALPLPDHSGRRRRRGPAQWCAEHRWRTLFAGLLVLAGAVVLLGGGLKTTAPADQLVGDSREAIKISEGADFGNRPTETIVVTCASGALTPAETKVLGAELRRAYAGVPGVATVGQPTRAPDGRTVVLAVGL